MGSPIINRNQIEFERVIGPFVNTLALRSDLSKNPSFRELLGRVQAVVAEAYAHQDVPFDMLVEALELEYDSSHTPLYQVMFSLEDGIQPLKQKI